MIDHITPDNLKRFQKIIDLSKTDLEKAKTEIKLLNRTTRTDLFNFIDSVYLEKLESEEVCKPLKKFIFSLL